MSGAATTDMLDDRGEDSVYVPSLPLSGDVDESITAVSEADSTLPIVSSDNPSSSVPLSKNALRRQRKEEHRLSTKLLRREREKEKKREKKRKRDEALAAGEPVEHLGPVRKRAKRPSGPQRRFGARLVVDLGFDEKMNEKEILSLCNQLSYSYGANRKAPCKFGELIFTSLNGQAERRLNEDLKGTHKRWKGVEWWEEGYERLWEAGAGEGDGEGARVEKETVVYLTADGEEEISELKEGETYIIGGLVDHNRYKNICLNKALSQNIRAAHLPIGKYLAELQTRKVLTVNQVFDILLTWLETRDWREAFWRQVPKRKFQGKERREGQEEGVPGDEDEQEEETVPADEDGDKKEPVGEDEVEPDEDEEHDEEDVEDTSEDPRTQVDTALAS